MSAKPSAREHQPSWAEVILGATLSVVLGVALGAVLLVIKPIEVVKELPKEADRVASMTYYIEGSRDTSKAKQAVAKRKTFAQGGSVSVIEDEINSFLAPPPAAKTPAPAPGAKAKADDKGKKDDKAAAPAAAPTGEMMNVAAPNFRVREGVVQIAVPVTFNLFDLIEQKVIVQARGTFAKKGSGFVFIPETLLVGSCPMQRLPFAAGYVENKFLTSQPVPEDIAAGWAKLAAVSVEGNTLKLAMP